MDVEGDLAENGGNLMHSKKRNIFCMVKIVTIPMIVISVFLIVAGKTPYLLHRIYRALFPPIELNLIVRTKKPSENNFFLTTLQSPQYSSNTFTVGYIDITEPEYLRECRGVLEKVHDSPLSTRLV